MRPGDRLVCGFAYPHKVGQRFADWPLHVTVVPWFRVEAGGDELANELRARLAGVGPFTVVMDEDRQFGYRKSKTVTLVREPTMLHDIEKKVRAVLKDREAWLADETTQRRRPFQPHVTVQKSGRLYAGETFTCDCLYIIEQKGGYKEIMNKIVL